MELQQNEDDGGLDFREFYADVHPEFLQFGEIINFKVCRNASPHLRGNVYVDYRDEASALLAFAAMNSRYYASKQLLLEFVPVTRWRSAICGEYQQGRVCKRGPHCNFLHPFQNPGGHYSWADRDRLPPASWQSRMRRVFGADSSGTPPHASGHLEYDGSGGGGGEKGASEWDAEDATPGPGSLPEEEYLLKLQKVRAQIEAEFEDMGAGAVVEDGGAARRRASGFRERTPLDRNTSDGGGRRMGSRERHDRRREGRGRSPSREGRRARQERHRDADTRRSRKHKRSEDRDRSGERDRRRVRDDREEGPREGDRWQLSEALEEQGHGNGEMGGRRRDHKGPQRHSDGGHRRVHDGAKGQERGVDGSSRKRKERGQKPEDGHRRVPRMEEEEDSARRRRQRRSREGEREKVPEIELQGAGLQAEVSDQAARERHLRELLLRKKQGLN